VNRIQCFMVEPVYSETEKDRDGKPAISHWRRVDTGEEQKGPYLFGPGAMWYMPWLEARYPTEPDRPQPWGRGPDGRILHVQTPGGGWIIDGRANNCTMKDDNEHRCWIRHGTPPNITADKNGNT